MQNKLHVFVARLTVAAVPRTLSPLPSPVPVRFCGSVPVEKEYKANIIDIYATVERILGALFNSAIRQHDGVWPDWNFGCMLRAVDVVVGSSQC